MNIIIRLARKLKIKPQGIKRQGKGESGPATFTMVKETC